MNLRENHNGGGNYNSEFFLIIKQQVPYVEKIIQDETWYEGERRNTYVHQNDPIVQKIRV